MKHVGIGTSLLLILVSGTIVGFRWQQDAQISRTQLKEMLVQLGLSHSKVAFPSPATVIDDRFFSLASAGGGA